MILKNLSKRTLLCLMVFNLIFSQSDIKESSNFTYTKKQAYNYYLKTIIPANLFFSTYGFMYGVTLGGQAIASGESPLTANTKWLIAPLISSLLISQATKDIKLNYLNKVDKSIKDDNFYYTIFFMGPDISQIKDFEAEGADGRWNANVLEASTTINYPPLGYRTGFFSKTIGLDLEMSLLGHHSKEQTAYYNFTGEIYNEEYAMYVELPPALNIEIPSHFLILHSLFIGLNTYYNLPNFGLNPYLGFGLGALFNSVQSQYPGPANLVQEEGKLALDELSWDFGYHGIIGFRHQQPDSFYYFEIRPMFHQFNYESGEGLLKEFDSFTLESLQFQIGIGTNLFK